MENHQRFKKSSLGIVDVARSRTWPFHDMAVGDAITVHDSKLFNAASVAYRYVGRKYGKKFSRKTLDDGSILVVRTA